MLCLEISYIRESGILGDHSCLFCKGSTDSSLPLPALSCHGGPHSPPSSQEPAPGLVTWNNRDPATAPQSRGWKQEGAYLREGGPVWDIGCIPLPLFSCLCQVPQWASGAFRRIGSVGIFESEVHVQRPADFPGKDTQPVFQIGHQARGLLDTCGEDEQASAQRVPATSAQRVPSTSAPDALPSSSGMPPYLCSAISPCTGCVWVPGMMRMTYQEVSE